MHPSLKISSLITAVIFSSPGLSNEANITTGAKDFAEHCSACHGKDAKGFGPMVTQLKLRASDLTRLSLDNGGKFPSKKISDLIDGRADKGLSRAHSNGEMPSWGATFRQEKGLSAASNITAEKQIKVRINNLVQYIRALQIPVKQ